ncbi:hypothetical protein JW897_21345 [Chromobacterium alkanivorans]|uniref:hypothetical protein n=1 Tax=Chromobacterium TaxID=535 RepID=UPI00065378F9|nr:MULTISPECIES: hypothetical protein [Chromobacterium]KMN77029.1 hypothetical protein VK98_19025 [Chromobacterium sp. LK11]MBN3006291.1 hypothetical protein [Chromobacterium alkanivorans]
MLATVQAEDFMHLLGKHCIFRNPQHPDISLQVQAVKLRPQAQSPHQTARRTPFVVELAAEGATDLADAVGQLELPATEHSDAIRLDLVWIGRVIPAGRDPALAYFQLPFN